MGKLHVVGIRCGKLVMSDLQQLATVYVIILNGKFSVGCHRFWKQYIFEKPSTDLAITTCQHTHCDLVISTFYYQKCPTDFAVFVLIIVVIQNYYTYSI